MTIEEKIADGTKTGVSEQNMEPGYYSGVSGTVASVFQPDTLLQAQYLDIYGRKTHLDPEKELMLAVLEDAVLCFQKYWRSQDRKSQELRKEAEEWILTKDPDNYLLSFDNVCEYLELNPGYFREGLLRWKPHNQRQKGSASDKQEIKQ